MSLDLEKLLRKSNEGRFTIMGTVPNAFLDDSIPGEIVPVYLFPGMTVAEPDGTKVAAWLPTASKLAMIPLETVTPVKKVKAHLSKNVRARELIEGLGQESRLLQEFIKKVEQHNVAHAMAVASLIQGIQMDMDMDNDVQQNFRTLFEEIEQYLPGDPYLEKLRTAADRYREHCEKRNTFLEGVERVQQLHQHSEQLRQEASQGAFAMDPQTIDDFKEKVESSHGKDYIEDAKNYVHSKVVTTCLLLGMKEHYTRGEVFETIRHFRPELLELGEDVFVKGVENGLKIGVDGYKAISEQGNDLPGGMLEFNETMGMYSLTPEGRNVALYLLEEERRHDQTSK